MNMMQPIDEKYVLKQGDCLEVMPTFASETVDLIYLDPPFFTQTIQRLKPRNHAQEFSFSDIWQSVDIYGNFIYQRVLEMYRLLKETGSIFIHCDRNSNHLIRLILDNIFGEDNFRAEIIWSYKRWSNAKKGLLPAHQTIYFYSKSENFIFNSIYTDYSATTNIDQILQKRTRNIQGKVVYATDEQGIPLFAGEKRGVPLSDVWEIPFLNPKAKERVGYPTQKPLLLLERIITLASKQNSVILDPFCGSGTTLVAAKLLGRNAIGIDCSDAAIHLTRQRLENPIKTESNLLAEGEHHYTHAEPELLALLYGLDIVPVPRNKAIDACLKSGYLGKPLPIRIQREHEDLIHLAGQLEKAAQKMGAFKAVLIKTQENVSLLTNSMAEFQTVIMIPAVSYSVRHLINQPAGNTQNSSKSTNPKH